MPNAKKEKSAKIYLSRNNKHEAFHNVAKLHYPLVVKPSLGQEAGKGRGWKDVQREG